ncbi:MAG: hypothetical protein ACKVOU_03625 [Cytophagales bacterium]
MNNLHDPNCINILLAAGFRYDDEDNLWYDENPNRKKYYYRIGIFNNGRFFDLYGGGYDTKLGRFFTIDECMLHVI